MSKSAKQDHTGKHHRKHANAAPEGSRAFEVGTGLPIFSQQLFGPQSSPEEVQRLLNEAGLPAEQRMALAAHIGNTQGNSHLQQLVAPSERCFERPPMVQRALPMPAGQMPQFAGLSAEATAQLLALTRTYLGDRNDVTGQAVVDAAVTQLGSTVNFGQTFLTDDSPDFRLHPSDRARREATRNIDHMVSGFTYPFSRDPLLFKVEIYPSGFLGDSPEESLAYLMGVIVHEYIHSLQFNRMAQPRAAEYSNAQTELQAWAWQAQNAVAMGLRPRTSGASQIIRNVILYYREYIASSPPPARRAEYRQLAANACQALEVNPAVLDR